MKYEIGEHVEVNGNKEAYIQSHYMEGIWIVRLWGAAGRLIGDIAANESEIKKI